MENQKEIETFINHGNLDIISEYDNLKGRLRKAAVYQSKMRVKNLKIEKEALENLLKQLPHRKKKNTIEEKKLIKEKQI